MSLRWLVGLTLAAAAPHAPLPPPPELRLEVRQASELQKLRSFLSTAGRYSPTLQPGPLGRSLGSALAVDLLDPASWSGSGLDPKAPASAVLRSESSLIALGAAGPDQVLQRAAQGLASLGTVEDRKIAGRKVVVAVAPARDGTRQPVAAVGLRGSRAWVQSGGPGLEQLTAALAAHPGSSPAPGAGSACLKGLAGEIHVSGPEACAGVAASPTSLSIDGRWSVGANALYPAREDPLGRFAPVGLSSGRVDLTPSGLAQLEPGLTSLLDGAQADAPCPACPPHLFVPLLQELTGSLGFATTTLKPDQSGPSSAIDRAGLVSTTLVGVIKDPARVRVLLEAIAHSLGASSVPGPPGEAATSGEDWRVGLQHQQVLLFGLVGKVLYLSNNLESRDRVLAALPQSPGRSDHGGEVHLDGPRIAKALGGLSVLDAARTTDLAIIFGVAVEAGPLLQALGPVTATFDPESSAVRVRAKLVLPPR